MGITPGRIRPPGKRFPPGAALGGRGPAVAVAAGVITATPNDYKGILATETCVLTPTVDGQRLTWAYSGGCVTAGYVKN